MSSLEGVDRMFSVAAPQARGKSAQDNIFAANNRAVALADKIGKDKVINGTVGSILDEDGNLVELEVVKEAYARLTPRQIIAYAPIQGYEKFLESCIDQCFGESRPSGYINACATPGGTGALLKVKVLFEGKPIPFLKVWGMYEGYSSGDAASVMVSTNRDGEAEFRINHWGTWLLRTRYDRPAAGELADRVNNEHYFSSITFFVP